MGAFGKTIEGEIKDEPGRAVAHSLVARGYTVAQAIEWTENHFDYTAFERIVNTVELDGLGQGQLL